ncbi:MULTISPECIES: acetyl-CoA C-acyltransferase [unclassified Pseudomonas]|uniref:acetyl-CoA C-acyltransferase n=1 Tax=unclassified Pseudomonas TaxID=196821 RepID=UPI000BD80792|nr:MULTISPECIES: acetyl-CoA C-acyltransferase [unclassified Pseudomonas]PVZ13853.1 acetyl-CoA C-acetyltransferase [Pseudomonas sp. URIL14HWK12:I12]PVZ24159.1 acetyl-CoA C-acetyltransferase [Pseudomonas sp. URIL14HWK12:I10]PVZ33202.1 acetyl-CoA C-acetyltransferase [Pseudomonas sp. URIL14HWK12:I11]SNZ10711.1 acetyl-CoA C-acetyltransferase [Pseudomonas sp. URIL14HWK12:I9]
MHSNDQDPVVIAAAVRTPMGALQGSLASLTAPQLGSAALAAALERGRVPADRVQQVLMGCVLPAGLGQAPARQAALGAGLPVSVACTTLNKMCGSGMQAVIIGHDQLLAGSAEVLLAGGMESMSNAPYLLPKARAGYRMGHGQVLDHMFLDGLEDAYDKGRLMGTFAEDCAGAEGVDRQAQDQWALKSLQRARQAIESGAFAAEVVAVSAQVGKQAVSVEHDEQPPKARPEKIPDLRPAFREGGTVTAANSSSISDGAAALLLMRQSQARALGAPVLAIVRGHAVHADAPGLFPLAPVGAIQRLLPKVGWAQSEVDLFEINEAFAVVALAAIQRLGLDPERVNVNGGACALGHPIGASGARILVTLIHALRQRSLRRGVAAICIGGGEATAVALEIPD